MSAGPIVIILGPYPHRSAAGGEMEAVGVDIPPTTERYITVTIVGLDADPTANDVEDVLSQALNQTEWRAHKVKFATLPPTE